MIFSKLLRRAKCVLGHLCAMNPTGPHVRITESFNMSKLRPHPKPVTTDSLGCDPAALFVYLRVWVQCAVCRQGGERPRFPWDRWGPLSPWCAYFLSQGKQQNGDQEFKSPPLTLTCIHYATLQLALANHTVLKESNKVNSNKVMKVIKFIQ